MKAVVLEIADEADLNNTMVGTTMNLLGLAIDSRYPLTTLCYRANYLPDTTAAKELLDILNYDSAHTLRSLETCLEIGNRLDDRGKARACAMVDSDKLKAWLAENECSSCLLVNGRCDMEALEGQSPLSFVDAQLVQTLERIGKGLVISHFSSVDKDTEVASYQSPTTRMMASLVNDLLHQMVTRGFEVDVSFLTKRDRKKMRNFDLDTLCIAFREFIMQLPNDTVLVCILDEIVLYETSSLSAEVDAIVRRLTRLVTRPSQAVFKLLVTSRGRSLDFHKYFKDKDILDLPADIEVDDSALWKIRNLSER